MKSRFVLVTALGLSLVVALLVLLTATSVSATPTAAPATIKIMVDTTATDVLKQLPSMGGQLLQEYGAYSVWVVPATQASRLADRTGVTLRPDFDAIDLRSGAIDTQAGEPSVPADLQDEASSGAQFWMVQYAGPIKAEWLAELTASGLEVVIYMPNNAYVVWGEAPRAKLAALSERNSMIQWTGAYHPAYRLSPALQEAAAKTESTELMNVTVQFYTTAATQNSLDQLLKLGGDVFKAPGRTLGFTNISLQVPAGKLIELANWPDVFNIEPWIAPQKYDEIQDQILAGNVISANGVVSPNSPGYITWLASKGFPTTPSSYPLVDIVDDGIDQGNASNVLHPDFHELGVLANPDRVIYIGNCTNDATGNGVGGHGNLNAGIVGAYNNLAGFPYVDANGYRIGLGVSPYGRVAGTKIFNNAGSYSVVNCGNTDQGVVAASYNAGAQFTSNSWGANVGGAYDSSSQAYDQLTRDASSTTGGNQEMLHVFSAGNAGSSANTIGSPATGKNLLAVAATENVRDQGVLDGCNLSAANNADDMATFSSRGPTDDGRYKPEISAPGTHVQGPASQDPGFNGTGVCGGSSSIYYPSGQTLYTWSSGTSHSAPAIAGTASLTWNYYNRVLKPGATPSPAMLKALLLNSTRYLRGVSTGDTLPSNSQGWGDANMGTLFDGTPRMLVDQSQLFTASGQEQSYYGSIMDPSKPFRVTLAWTDAPGSTTGNAYVNNLDLEVTVNGVTYRGNVFSGAFSTSGGTADVRNNVESVFLPAGTSGGYTVRVVATNLAGDGVPGTGTSTDQDYALVIYNNSIGPAGTLQGQVRNASNGNPIPTAQVSMYSVPTQTFTLPVDTNGNYSILLSVGSYTVTGSAYGYLPSTLTGVQVVSGTTTTQNISLTIAPTYVISGFVRDSATTDPLWATVSVIGTPFNPPFSSVQTDPATGFYSMTVSGGQSYTLTASALLHTAASQGVTPVADTNVNFNLVATTQNGGIIGWVRNYYTNDPIPNATVTVAASGNPSDQTDANGYFEIFNLTPGTYTATATANLYSPVSISNIQVLSSNVAIRTFLLPTSQLNYHPAQLNKTLAFGQIATDTAGLVISNTGLGALTFTLQESMGDSDPPGDYLIVGSTSSSNRSISQSLTLLGYTYDITTESAFNALPVAALVPYRAVIYASSSSTGLPKLVSYLDNGGRLLVVDDDLGYSNGSTVFYRQYLEAQYGGDDATNNGAGTVVGEDIMTGLSPAITNDPYPDYYTITGTNTITVFVYSTAGPGNNGPAGSRTARNSYKAVYLPFDIYYLGTSTVGEQIETDVLQRALTWLGGSAYDPIPWLTEAPITGTLAQNNAQNIQLVWNASVAQVTQPGTYTGTLRIKNNDPVAQNASVPVLMQVNPAASQGLLTGVVSTTGICDVNLAPINGAQVYLQGNSGFSQTLLTDAAGQYSYWLDQAQSPYTVTVSYADHLTTAVSVGVTGGVTTTQNFTLRLQKACIAYAPNSLSATAQLGNSAPNQTVVVTSSGALPLDFNVFEVPASLPVGGGPDAFGYTWITSTYQYITATDGTALGPVDDGEASIVLPFPFTFYGVSSTNLRVGNNGAVLFNATTGDVLAGNDAISSAPNYFIAPFWDDIDSDTGNVYWKTIGSSPNRKVVIEWYNRPHYSNVGSATFELVLFENGNVQFQYQDTDFGNASYNNGVSATAGIRGADAANSLQYSYNQAVLTNGLSLCFVKPGNSPCDAVDVPWLSVSPTSTVGLTGTPPSSLQLTVGFNSASLPLPGTYTANLLVSHNTPQPAVNIPVTFNVTAPATYGQINGVVNGLAVCDAPGAPLSGANVAITGGTVATATTNASGQYSYYLLGGSAYTLTVSRAGYATQSTVVNVTQSQTTTTNFNLRLLAPCQSLSASSLSNKQPTNRVATQTLTINNTGAAALAWSFQELAAARVETVAVPQMTLGNGVDKFSSSPRSNVMSFGGNPLAPTADISITQSSSQAVESGNSVSCNSSAGHADNSYYRVFDLPTFGISGDFKVTAVEIGVEDATAGSTDQPVTVNLYTLNGAFVVANLTPIGGATVNVTDQALTRLTIPVTGTAPAGSKLVVEIFTPDGQTAGNFFFIGSNTAAESAASYIRASSCGLTEPATTASIGYPDMHIVMNVYGSSGPSCTPNALPWVSTLPVSGTTAADSSSAVSVVFNSTGLTNGVYTGTLCYASNSTVAPNVSIPVTLTIGTYDLYMPIIRK